MERETQYYCKACQKQFISTKPWHPRCLLCDADEGHTLEIVQCDVCQTDFHFGDPQKGGIIANPDYIGGNRHEVLLGEVVYLIELVQWRTCFQCCRKLLKNGKGEIVPPKICGNCNAVCRDMHGWDGEVLSDNFECHGGYGSTQFDMENHRFPRVTSGFVPGWYCYPCLDIEVKEGRTTKL